MIERRGVCCVCPQQRPCAGHDGGQEAKLQSNLSQPHCEPINRPLLSTTDPDAPVLRQSKICGNGDSRPRYKQHRAVDDQCGVITALATTPGEVEATNQTEILPDQHAADTVVADQQNGTNANYRTLQECKVRMRMGPLFGRNPARYQGIFPKEKFQDDAVENFYHFPAEQKLYPRRRKTFNLDGKSEPLRSAVVRDFQFTRLPAQETAF